jgi:pSer/pThr/pTyr-binding forkhead associated (FHA) protein
MGSTNGTFVNGEKVKRQRLHDGEVIAIGNFRIQYLAASDRPSGFSETMSMKLDAQGQPARQPHAVFQDLNGRISEAIATGQNWA